MSFVFLFGGFLFLSALLLGAYRYGLLPVAVIIAALQFHQAVLGASLYWEFGPGLLLSPGSCLLFASNVAMLLYVYARSGAEAARTIFYVIIGANLVVVGMNAIVGVHMAIVPHINFLDVPASLFEVPITAALVGIAVLSVTQLAALSLFNVIQSRLPAWGLPLAMAIALSVALSLDTVGYLVPLFWSDPNLGTMILSGVVSKGGAGVVFGLVWGEVARRQKGRRLESLRRLFRVLAWSERGQSFREETARLYRHDDSDIGGEETRVEDFENGDDWAADDVRRRLTKLPFGVCVVSGEEIQFANANFAAQVAAIEPDELHGRPIAEFLSTDDYEILRTMGEEEDGAEHEHELTDLQGRRLPVESSAVEMEFDGKLCTVITSRDITEKRQLRQQLHHADRLASAGSMAAGLAHEINNPLAYVLANQSFAIEAIRHLARNPRMGGSDLAGELREISEALEESMDGMERIRTIVEQLGEHPSERDESTPTDVSSEVESSAKTEREVLRVLFVDDEPALARVVRRKLSDFDITDCVSGAEALDAIEESEPFDAILCDLMMPNMTGMQFYETLQARDPTLAERVIFLTGGAFTSRAESFLEEVENPVLRKPFDWDEVIATISEISDDGASEAG